MNRHSRSWLDRLTVDGLIVHGARWLMLTALVFVPWAYGGIPRWAAETMNGIVATVFALWMFGCLLRKSWPSVPRTLAITAVLLVGYVWLVAWNARFDYDPVTHDWTPLEPWFSWLPGSVDQSASFTMARRVSALLMAACFVCDMARRSGWRQRLLGTLALNGAALVLFGLVQRLTDAPSIFWGNDDFGQTFFATYRYHSNAGAFINLTWPLLAGFVALSFMRRSPWKTKLAWGAALIVCLAGVLVNASRAASLFALALGGLWIGWLVWQASRGRIKGVSSSVASVAGGLLLLLIIALAAMAGLDATVRRWSRFGEEISIDNPRLLVAKVCFGMISESSWWGFGPGSWQTAFPYFSSEIGDRASGVWEHAHDDYLETITDWGIVGAAGWAVIVFGGLVGSWIHFWRHRSSLAEAERTMHFAAFTALLVTLLHSLVDFPLQIPSLQLCFAALLGLMWGGRHWLREGDQPHRRRHARSSHRSAHRGKRSPQ
jgi:hypothetical protein